MGDVYSFNQFNPQEYIKVIKDRIIKPRFRVSLLNYNESVKEDITEYVQIGSGSLTINYQQGQRRSLNFVLDNTTGRFTPKALVNGIWLDTKFKLELGIELSNGDTVYNSAGIFVVSNPNALRVNAQKVVNVQCLDKFSLIDGTLGGTLETTYQIPVGSNIKEVFENTLNIDGGNGYPLDTKPIVFDGDYKDAVTQYDVIKAPAEAVGGILIELANMLGCDIWYGVDGNLIVRSGTRNISYVTKPTQWYYKDTELEYLSNSTIYDFSLVRNSVTVVGANANGDSIYVGIAENTNPQSPTRVSLVGRRLMYLDDPNVFSEDLAQQRAEYELNKVSILQNLISLESTYMIHLDVNNCIAIDDEFFGYKGDRFVVQSITIPLATESRIVMECTNIATLPYYEA